MKKRITYLVASLLIAITLAGALPMSAVASNDLSVTTSEEVTVQRAEDTTVYTRIYNGKLQYRIWSNTYAKWLTDWTDC